jgi:hypothetical protein
MITPQQVEQTAKDIVNFWDESTLPDGDKHKILEMVKDYYTDENNHVFQQYLAQLCERTIDRRVPRTGFESDNE